MKTKHNQKPHAEEKRLWRNVSMGFVVALLALAGVLIVAQHAGIRRAQEQSARKNPLGGASGAASGGGVSGGSSLKGLAQNKSTNQGRAASASGGGGGNRTLEATTRSQTSSLTETELHRLQTRIETLNNGGNYADALVALDTLLSNSLLPRIRHEALLKRGGLLAVLGRKDEAWSTLLSLLNSGRDPDIIEMTIPKMFVLGKELGLIETELQRFEQEYRTNPEDLRLSRILAGIYACSGIPAEEIAVREKLASEEKDPVNLARLATLYSQQGDYNSAANTAQRMAELDTATSQESLVRKAAFQIKGNDIIAAEETCKQVVQSAIPNAQALLRVGYMYEQMNHFSEAADAFQRAANSATEAFRQERSMLEACRMNLKLGRSTQDAEQAIVKLASDAVADGVRNDARKLLATIKK